MTLDEIINAIEEHGAAELKLALFELKSARDVLRTMLDAPLVSDVAKGFVRPLFEPHPDDV